MEWISCIRKSIEIIEENLTEDISVAQIAEQVFISPYFLQKGFSIMTGYSIAEYMRNRKLYQSAVELQTGCDKIIDIALKYGYETPESFTKAFTRFHGATPSQVKAGAPFTVFLPLKLTIKVFGGNQMNVKIVKMFPFKVIGFAKEVEYDQSFKEIPKFWDEICEKYANNIYAGNPPRNACEQAIMDYCIGEYGVCIDDVKKGKVLYIIAGKYTGGEIPEGMMAYEFPAGEWAVFDCIGPVPESIQNMSKKVFQEWLPGNSEYEICGNANIEWYDCINGEMSDADYHSAIWIPVKRKVN